MKKTQKNARKRIPLSKIYVGKGEKVRANRERGDIFEVNPESWTQLKGSNEKRI